MPNRNYEMRPTPVATAKDGVGTRKFRVNQDPADSIGEGMRASVEQDTVGESPAEARVRKKRLASDTTTPQPVLAELVEDWGAGSRALQNPSLGLDLIRHWTTTLLRDSFQHHADLARNPIAHADILDYIARHNARSNGHFVGAHANTAHPTFEFLLDQRDFMITDACMSNPHLPDDLRDRDAQRQRHADNMNEDAAILIAEAGLPVSAARQNAIRVAIEAARDGRA